MEVSYLANTMQAMSVVESLGVQKYKNMHPKATLEDIYRDQGAVNYRCVVVCPGHLVEKWKSEILEEIPFAHAEVVHSLGQLMEIQKQGRTPVGKNFYIFSKDFLKLGTQTAPIPTQTKRTYASMLYCADCKEETGREIAMKGKYEDRECPRCHGKHSYKRPLVEYGRKYGLICHACGELLIQNRGYNTDDVKFAEVLEASVIRPESMSSHVAGTDKCFCCGASLWGANAKPLVAFGSMPKKSKWYRISHFANHTRKTKKSAFVLRGHEQDYYQTQIAKVQDVSGALTLDGLTVNASEYGPRKVAPAQYIKKHLKGFFDVCILDEAHKYLGDGSAQAVAAHACVKSSRFTLALTGTIANGTATSFFRLFYMLEPKKMLREGYTFNKVTKFVHDYGCTEAMYEGSVNFNGTKNVCSRGRQLSPPRVKPGISPLIVGKFMLDRTLFLDLSDLSKYLPELKEEIILCDLPQDVKKETERVVDTLKEAANGSTGMACLSTMLDFGLSFPDKPYGRENIKDPHVAGAILCPVKNLDTYRETLLPKEEKLIELINQEISEGRNCFVYASYTGKEESNITGRLQAIIETHCNLSGRVQILESASPSASEREEWMHKKASEGIKVFITNPMNVETGLDFCFKYEGVEYNYPTLIFYQISYRLDVIWQASKRAHRLNQRMECRNYYLAYEGTLQSAALKIMGKKIVAVSAIQGKFSTEGLATMAQGVDAQAELAASLSKLDEDNRESLSNMFDALKKDEQGEEEDAFQSFVPSKTYYELLGLKKEDETVDGETFETPSIFEETSSISSLFALAEMDYTTPVVEKKRTSKKEVVQEEVQMDIFSAFSFEEFSFEKADKPKKKASAKVQENQMTLFGFVS